MMCQRIGLLPISIIGFGRTAVSSLMRVPAPPARITAFTGGEDTDVGRSRPASGTVAGLLSHRSHRGFTSAPIDEETLQQLYYQNPEFGFYLVKLVVKRLASNVERLEAQLVAKPSDSSSAISG